MNSALPAIEIPYDQTQLCCSDLVFNKICFLKWSWHDKERGILPVAREKMQEKRSKVYRDAECSHHLGQTDCGSTVVSPTELEQRWAQEGTPPARGYYTVSQKEERKPAGKFCQIILCRSNNLFFISVCKVQTRLHEFEDLELGLSFPWKRWQNSSPVVFSRWHFTWIRYLHSSLRGRKGSRENAHAKLNIFFFF